MNATAQTPPADELYAVGEQIKALEARKSELRQLMLTDPSARTGNDYVAIVKEVETRRLDQTALRAMYPAIAEEHTHAVRETRVEPHRIDHETGEIMPVRRAQKLHTMRVV